jgi:hypothetical protein
MITLSKVSKWYPNFQVLNHCSTEVAKGEVVVVCGPSGSGKSTLIKCVNGGGTLPALFGLSRTQLPAAMDMLSGEGVSGTQETALGAAGMFTSIMMDQGAFWRNGGNRRHQRRRLRGVAIRPVQEDGGAPGCGGSPTRNCCRRVTSAIGPPPSN